MARKAPRVKIDLGGARKDIKMFKTAAKVRLSTELKKEIKDSILRGVSPVKGKGRFQKYSKSYIQAIKNEAWLDASGEYFIYRNIGGKVKKIIVDGKKLTPKTLQAELGKKVSPVNLKLTGEMLKSMFVRPIQRGLLIGFDNKLADIHNRLGAGKKKVIRRLLPTNDGESFNRSITNKLNEVLDKLAKQIFK